MADDLEDIEQPGQQQAGEGQQHVAVARAQALAAELVDQPARGAGVGHRGAELGAEGGGDQQGRQHQGDHAHQVDDRGLVQGHRLLVETQRQQGRIDQVDGAGEPLRMAHRAHARGGVVVLAEVTRGLEALHGDDQPQQQLQRQRALRAGRAVGQHARHVLLRGMHGEAGEQAGDDRQLQAHGELLQALHHAETAQVAGGEDEQVDQRGDDFGQCAAPHVDDAPGERTEEVEVVGHGDEVGEGQHPGRQPFAKVLQRRAPALGRVAQVADVEAHGAAEGIAQGAQDEHGQRRPAAEVDQHHRAEDEEAAADDRGQRGHGGAPHRCLGDAWPEQQGGHQQQRQHDHRGHSRTSGSQGFEGAYSSAMRPALQARGRRL